MINNMINSSIFPQLSGKELMDRMKFMRTPSSMIYYLLFVIFTSTLTACSKDDEYDVYHDWQERNDAWFADVAGQARAAIQQARSQYGNSWADRTE